MLIIISTYPPLAPESHIQRWWRGSVVRASVFQLADFPWYVPDLWLTCDHFVGKASTMGQPTRPAQPPTLRLRVGGWVGLRPSVGRGMSSISVARLVKLLAAVSPSSKCLYEGKADVVYLQVTLCDPHLSARVVELLTIGAIQVHFLSFPKKLLTQWWWWWFTFPIPCMFAGEYGDDVACNV